QHGCSYDRPAVRKRDAAGAAAVPRHSDLAAMRTLLLLCGVAAVAAGLAGAAPPAPPAPHDTQPWWSPQGTTIAFQRDSAAAPGGDVFFTPAARGDAVDIIGAGRARGFRPGSG